MSEEKLIIDDTQCECCQHNQDIQNKSLEGQPEEYTGPIHVPLQWQHILVFSLIALAGGIGTLLFKGINNWIFAIQAACLFAVLSYTAYVDIKLKLVSNWIHLIVIGLSLLNLVSYIPNKDYLSLIEMGIGFIFVPLPLFIAAVASKGKIGGGDIKLMGACGLLLGISRGIPALMIGLLIAIIVNLILIAFKKADKNTSFAMVPYLAIGCMIAYFV